MSFTRQVLAFIAIWALLIYIFITKLNATGETEEIKKLNRALNYLESSKSLDKELRQLLDEYANDITNGDSKTDLLKKLNAKFQEASNENSYVMKTQQLGVPSDEYEHNRKRIGNNIQEMWMFVQAEAQKVEKFIKKDDSQQALKELSNFIQLATEQKR